MKLETNNISIWKQYLLRIVNLHNLIERLSETGSQSYSAYILRYSSPILLLQYAAYQFIIKVKSILLGIPCKYPDL